MTIKEKIKKLKHNHALMMLVCCGVPLLLLLGAVYFFGLSRSYLFWFVLLLCPLMHYFMMKDMRGDKKDEGDKKCGEKSLAFKYAF